MQRFCAIAGTSVGALNGALYHQVCHTGDRSLALRLWTNLTPQKIQQVAWKTLPAKAILYLMLSAFALAGTGFLNVVRFDVDAELHSQWDLWRTLFFHSIGMVLLVLIAAGYLIGIAYIVHAVLGSGPAFVVVMLIVLVVLPRASGRLGERLAIFSDAPLRGLIEAIDIDSLRRDPPPVRCTLARRGSSFNGSPLRWLSASVPLYASASDLPDREATIKLLLGTAAIPEVFPPQQVVGQSFVDGGAADNRPTLSVASFRPDTVIVVYLDHRYGRMSRSGCG